MQRSRLLKHLVLLMFFIFFTNEIALKLHWYYSLAWFDMAMHFLGGFWIGLFFLYIFNYFFHPKPVFWKQFIGVLLFVFLFGVFYEIFEFFLDIIAREAWSLTDTSSDVFFDLFGGVSAVYYCRFYLLSQIMPAEKNNVQ